jgi:hypothetical protein
MRHVFYYISLSIRPVLFVVYLMTLSVAQTIWRRMIERLMIAESERILRKAVVAELLLFVAFALKY